MMSFEEFAVCAMVIKESYPKSGVLTNDSAMKVWYDMLKDLNSNDLQLAVKRHIATNTFPPTIAELRKASMPQMFVKDWSEGWELVMRAIRKFGSYEPVKAVEWMKGIDPIAADVARRLDFVKLCLSENQMQDRANFRMIYEKEAEREMKLNQMPVSVRPQLEGQRKVANLIEGVFKQVE